MISKIFQTSTTFAQENHQKMMKFKRSALAVAAMLPIGLLAGGANPTDAAVVGPPMPTAQNAEAGALTPNEASRVLQENKVNSLDRPMFEAIAKDKSVATVQPNRMIKKNNPIQIPHHSRQGRRTEPLPPLGSLTGRQVDTMLTEMRASAFKWDQEIIAMEATVDTLNDILVETGRDPNYDSDSLRATTRVRDLAKESLSRSRDALVETLDKVNVIEAYKNTSDYARKNNNSEGVRVEISTVTDTVKGLQGNPPLAQVLITKDGDPAPGASVFIEQGVGSRKIWASTTTNADGTVVFEIEKGTLGVNEIKVQTRVSGEPLVTEQDTVNILK